MSVFEDLIDFEIIENQKENIQSLPGGRSARMLANLYSPSPLQPLSTPTPSDTKNLNDAIRQEYEAELANISESDDPLDIYDRYVRWTMDAYPSAQATPSSQLLPLLERATKTFLNSAQYKNDPRYLKLWLSYIRFFSESPRETFAFLARHNIGEGLALFYEEFATWLEGADRWVQAEEIYKLGIEREARPIPRLLRKFNEFQGRFAQRPEDSNEPSSPALPTVRPALAAKLDPFATVAPRDPQAPRPNSGVGGTATTKSGRQKLMIFSDGDEAAPAVSGDSTKGWESIGALADRKKENTMEPKPWVGETLKAGGKKSNTKLAVFKDESSRIPFPQIPIMPELQRVTVNPKTGRSEHVFVNLEILYPVPGTNGVEMCLEEVMASHRGWLEKVWNPEKDRRSTPQLRDLSEEVNEMENVTREFSDKLIIARDSVMLDENGVAKEHSRGGKGRRMKVKEVNETQIIKAKLSSPSGPKMKKRKASKEQTMTLHTRAATDEIYDLFNQPLKPAEEEEEEEEDETDDDDDMTDCDYTSGAESMTGRLGGTSEAGDDETSEVKSVSEWSEFTTRKHVPAIGESDDEDTRASRFSVIGDISTAEEDLDLEAIERNIANTKLTDDSDRIERVQQAVEEELATPVSPELPTNSRTMFVPIPPEDYVPPTHPFRDPSQVSLNRLPFMTPIAEKTETSLSIPANRMDEDYFNSKTPSKVNGIRKRARSINENEELGSSPFRESPFQPTPLKDAKPASEKISQPLLGKNLKTNKTTKIILKVKSIGGPLANEIAQKGPIVKELQCNPTDDFHRSAILANIQPALTTYEGYFEHKDEKMGRGAEIAKFAKVAAKMKKNANDKTATNLAMFPQLHFPATDRHYLVKKELGTGAFGAVYLIESIVSDDTENTEAGGKAIMGKGTFDGVGRKPLEALKMEQPVTAWEFYMMRQAKRRLGVSRAADSIIDVYEMHLYQDECYLIEEYRNQGTLLDVVNFFAKNNNVDEPLAMFFTIELFRTIEALHSKDILHGDLKADNCLVRLDAIAESSWSSCYARDGSGGWDKKGIAMIDFGRGIDMKAFRPDVQFIADWPTTPQDCAEIRETRPWTYQIDYHGLAGIIHSLLYMKYIDTVAEPGVGVGIGAGTGKTWRVRENLKRYWQTEIWGEVFRLLLNPGANVEHEEGGRMPVLKGMRTLREEMETWLEGKGVGLQLSLKKLEAHIKSTRR